MKIYKVIRLAALLILVALVALLLTNPTRLTDSQDPAVPEHAKAFQDKLLELENASARGASGAEVRLTSEEINAALAQSGSVAADAPGPEAVPMKSTQVAFEGDQVRGQFLTEMYGKDTVVTVAGRLGSKDGYVTFRPTEFKIGSLPVPVSLVEARLQQKLAEPENRAKLKLPDFISGLRVENGQLVISEK